jgi:LAO/AO transport system kinase
MAIPSHDLLAGVLAGKQRDIARLITRAEAGDEECQPTLQEIYKHTGNAHIVGITGVPGSGKSTLLKSFATTIRNAGLKVGIVAIDPSSPFSGGAIMGDRIRMNELSGDPGVFIRSMATRGALGGLCRAALDAVDILDAAGYDMVMIETVGVGQDEVDIVRAAHTTVVVSAPGLGDDIQAIKAGVLEIADIHVVSKCDKPESQRTISDLKNMLMLDMPRDPNWLPPVVSTSAEANTGIAELFATVQKHRAYLESSGNMVTRKRQIVEARIIKNAENLLRERFMRYHASKFVTKVLEKELSPYAAAKLLLETV